MQMDCINLIWMRSLPNRCCGSVRVSFHSKVQGWGGVTEGILKFPYRRSAEDNVQICAYHNDLSSDLHTMAFTMRSATVMNASVAKPESRVRCVAPVASLQSRVAK